MGQSNRKERLYEKSSPITKVKKVKVHGKFVSLRLRILITLLINIAEVNT